MALPRLGHPPRTVAGLRGGASRGEMGEAMSTAEKDAAGVKREARVPRIVTEEEREAGRKLREER